MQLKGITSPDCHCIMHRMVTYCGHLLVLIHPVDRTDVYTVVTRQPANVIRGKPLPPCMYAIQLGTIPQNSHPQHNMLSQHINY